MALRSALVDQARVISKVGTGQRVEGRTLLDREAGSWFRARMEMQSPGIEAADQQSIERTTTRPQLMFGVKDKDGGLLQDDNGGCIVRPQDQVEVWSRELGRGVWEVTDEPHPIRKKRRLLGWQVDLARVSYGQFRT